MLKKKKKITCNKSLVQAFYPFRFYKANKVVMYVNNTWTLR